MRGPENHSRVIPRRSAVRRSEANEIDLLRAALGELEEATDR